MLLVLAVMGLVAMLVVPRLDAAVPAYRLRAAARQIASTITWARSESIVRGISLGVRYDFEAGTYRVVERPPAGTSPGAGAAGQGRLPGGRLPDGVSFAGISYAGGASAKRGAATVYFSFLGACGAHSIHLADKDGNRFTIEVNLYE